MDLCMKRVLLITAGNLSLSLGIVGIFLPVLPTTPFLLLSAACYMKSSRKLYDWLLNHPVLGLYIRSYIKYRAITMRAKVISIIALWIVLGASVVFFVSLTWLRILLLFIGAGVTVYLLHFRTLNDEIIRQVEEGYGSSDIP